MSVAIDPKAVPIQKRPIDAPRAAYVHVPFCRHRCGYCNFTLVSGRDDLIEEYLRAVELELRRVGTAHRNDSDRNATVGSTHPTLRAPNKMAGDCPNFAEPAEQNGTVPLSEAVLLDALSEIDTLYFGGGTPTYLSPPQLGRLANAVLRRHPLASGYEWTVEANPADVNESLIDTLSQLGITRISLGGQSFRPEKLRLLERDHEAADIEKAVELSRSAGMQVSLDLIFAVPGETTSDWESELAAAIALAPDHISSYGLTFERGTAFWSRRLHGRLDEVPEELQREMYALAIDRLVAAGFEHYEVSNFARPGCRSRHNETYWSGDGYFAYGPGAARYVGGVRETNHRSTTAYLKRIFAGLSSVAERERLSPEARAREQLVFGLRRIEGVSRREFRDRTGAAIDSLVGKALHRFVPLGLLNDDGERIRLTREGLFVSDAMWPEML